MKPAFWNSTLKSELCGAIWIDRAEASAPDLAARLDAEWPAIRDQFVARAKRWLDEPEYEAIVISAQ